jgi:hypothetical protein
LYRSGSILSAYDPGQAPQVIRIKRCDPTRGFFTY